ncbi:phage terminase small subunit [Paenibacillus gansuensis]|uniref:Phage terminase small subunit n=1 Tax=Paenibacillus gansuensis TaxID=306542 RepID=A0ABW5PFJ1_9BACL
MSRQRSPDREKAAKLWIRSGRTMKPAEIADKLGVSAALVRKWKSMDNWDELPEPKRGAPRGNRNAKGNKGGSAPIGNDNAVKHGLFRKLLPDDPIYLEIFDATENMSRLEMLWYQIRIAWSNILDAQRKMHVTSKDEMIKEVKKRKFEVHSDGDNMVPIMVEEEFEFQFAWDRQATALNAQTQAMHRLTTMIKQYEDMLRTMPPEDVHDEHRLRLIKLKAEVEKVTKDDTKQPLTLTVDYGDDEP